MFVINTEEFELRFVGPWEAEGQSEGEERFDLRVINLLENVLETAIVFLEDSVLGGHELVPHQKYVEDNKSNGQLTKGIFFAIAILNDACANPAIDF